jgi:hypothetical protein
MLNPIKRSSRLVAAVWVVGLALRNLGAPVYADARCDLPRAVSTATANTYQYRAAGNRCEGQFTAEVVAVGMDVVGYTDGDTPLPDGDATLTWSSGPGEIAHLVARDLHPGLDYRMDTRVPAGVTTYSWPGDVRGRLSLRGGHVAVLVRVKRTIGTELEDVALPVRFSARRGPLLVVVVPQVDVRQPRVTLTRYDPSSPPVSVITNQPIDVQGASGGESIAVPLNVTRAGLYRLEVVAPKRYESRGLAGVTLWIEVNA